MNLEKEIGRLSAETGKKTAEIEEEVKALVTEGYSELAAVAIWKSSNNNKLGGKFLESTTFRVAGIDEYKGERVQARETKDGAKNVANIQAFVSDGEDQTLCSMGLWEDNAEVVDSMEPGKVYTASIKIKGTERNGLPDAAVIGNEISEGKDDSMPSMVELLKEYQPAELSTLEEYVGTNAFFNGIVGDVFDTGSSIGYSVSGIDSNPVSVYPIHETDVEKGDVVIVGGRVYSSAKGLGIGSGVIFRA